MVEFMSITWGHVSELESWPMDLDGWAHVKINYSVVSDWICSGSTAHLPLKKRRTFPLWLIFGVSAPLHFIHS